MTLLHSPSKFLAAFGIAAGTVLAVPALAQEQQAPAASESSAPSYSDQQLQAFAVAFLEVDKVKRDYTQRLQNAGSEDAQKTIQSEASQEMKKAVEGTDGISLDQYNQIIQSAQTDPDLAGKLNNVIGQAAKTQ